MGLTLKDKITLHSIEFENLYMSIENFRRLSDLQVEVVVGFYRSTKDKINGAKPIDIKIEVLLITKNQLSALPIYTTLYAKLHEVYPNSIPVESDEITDAPKLTPKIKNNTLIGRMQAKSGIVTVGFDLISVLASFPIAEDGSFSADMGVAGIVMHEDLNLIFIAKETDKKPSDPTIIKINKDTRGNFTAEAV